MMLSGRYVAAGLIGLAFVCGCRLGTAVAEEKPAVNSVAPGTQLFTITVKGVDKDLGSNLYS
jgi:hypothetical protein